MSDKIVQFNKEVIKGQLKEQVRGSIEETLNELLEKEAETLTQAARRYERNEARQGYRSGHYDRRLTTPSGGVTLHLSTRFHNIYSKLSTCSSNRKSSTSLNPLTCKV